MSARGEFGDRGERLSIRGRVTGLAFHGAETLVTVQPDAPELKVEHAGSPPEAGSAVTVEVRDGWIIPEANKGVYS